VKLSDGGEFSECILKDAFMRALEEFGINKDYN